MKSLKDSILDLIEHLNEDEIGEIYLKLDKKLWEKTRGELEQEIRDLKDIKDIEGKLQKVSVELLLEQSKSDSEYSIEKVKELQSLYKELSNRKEKIMT